MPSALSALSAPFASRELNGETLLDELASLCQAAMPQKHLSGRSRAYQLHDPFAQDTVWANEGGLLARNELPFSDKIYRRITAIALPARSSKGVAAVKSGFEGIR